MIIDFTLAAARRHPYTNIGEIYDPQPVVMVSSFILPVRLAFESWYGCTNEPEAVTWITTELWDLFLKEFAAVVKDAG